MRFEMSAIFRASGAAHLLLLHEKLQLCTKYQLTLISERDRPLVDAPESDKHLLRRNIKSASFRPACNLDAERLVRHVPLHGDGFPPGMTPNRSSNHPLAS